YMNGSKYLHCDMKPDNVLTNALVQTKIIDFAISRPIRGALMYRLFYREKKPQGTPSYMSPEQIQRLPLDYRSDIYNFGATLYELTA
ncbi:protein kinase domain-containing protein, partial [Vibrio parahaemolyticus]